MARNDDETPDNIIAFPLIGYAPPTAPTPPEPDTTAETESAPTPHGDTTNGWWAAPARPRRSPLDVVSELHDPGLSRPAINTIDDDLAAPAGAGHIPSTFLRAPGDTGNRPAYTQHLGALSMAAALAVVVAALRGIHTLVQARRASREQRQAVDRVATTGSGAGGGGGGRGRRVPSGPEFGRTHLGRGTGSGGRGGAGGGRGGADRTPPGSGRRNRTPGAAPGGRDNNHGGRTRRPHKPRTDRHGNQQRDGKDHAGGVHRNSQGGNRKALDRARRKRLERSAKDGRTDIAKRDDRRPGTRRDKTADRHGPKNRRREDQHARKDRHGKNKGRTTLAQAISEEAERRMKKRRTSMKPPLWSRKGTTGTKNTRKPGGAGSNPTGSKNGAGRTTSPGGDRGYWGRAQARARDYWQRRHHTHTTGTGTGTGDGFTWGTRERTTPWQAAGMATGHTPGDYTVTVERLDNIGDAARPHTPTAALTPPRMALGPAPVKNFPRPGTRRPRPMPYIPPSGVKENRMSTVPAAPSGRLPGSRRIPGMDAQHYTEVTLDDACSLLESLTVESFATHDHCADLAARARALRERLLALAEDLATTHNVIGQATSAAMARLAEDMDVLARQAEAMSAQSLHAAESTEAADTALNDAYRPITQATADAGLLAPSAPAHNQT